MNKFEASLSELERQAQKDSDYAPIVDDLYGVRRRLVKLNTPDTFDHPAIVEVQPPSKLLILGALKNAASRMESPRFGHKLGENFRDELGGKLDGKVKLPDLKLLTLADPISPAEKELILQIDLHIRMYYDRTIKAARRVLNNVDEIRSRSEGQLRNIRGIGPDSAGFLSVGFALL